MDAIAINKLCMFNFRYFTMYLAHRIYTLKSPDNHAADLLLLKF